MHHLCIFFYTFSTFAQKIFRIWGCNFTWSFGKVICSKSVKMMFVTSIIRHKLWIIYAFLDFFVQKSFFDQKLFSYYCNKFDYPGFIVCFSCFVLFYRKCTNLLYITHIVHDSSIPQMEFWTTGLTDGVHSNRPC